MSSNYPDPYSSLPPRPEPPHQEAGRAFMSGFSGCLGVGLAIVLVIIVLVIVASAAGHH